MLLPHLELITTWLRARFGATDRGASLIEYALLVALIAIVCVAAVTLLGERASQNFDSAANLL